MGSVRLTERHVRHDPPTPDELSAIDREVRATLDDVAAALAAAGARSMVACAGTPTTLQAMSLGLDRYDPDRIHRTWLSRDEAGRILSEASRRTTGELS